MITSSDGELTDQEDKLYDKFAMLNGFKAQSRVDKLLLDSVLEQGQVKTDTYGFMSGAKSF